MIKLVVGSKDEFVVLKEALHGYALVLDIGQLALDIHGPHDGWSEDNREVERSHLIHVNNGTPDRRSNDLPGSHSHAA
jgi:hypothetical protein